jgi:hypothetical protein
MQGIFAVSLKTYKMKWVSSEGGPLIIISASDIQKYGGSITRKVEPGKMYPYNKNFMDPSVSHYGEVCQCEEEIAAWDIDDMTIVILGDEPLSTVWIPCEDGGIIMRCVHLNKNPDPRALLNSVDDMKWIHNFFLEVEHEKWYLYDSLMMGTELEHESFQEIILSKGKYTVSSCRYRPDNESLFILHQFKITRV